MPNLRGGKAYKKGKKKPAVAEVGGDSGGGKFSGREDGQDYGRVLRLLGDRRAMCFCNDGAERIGKFRGAICRGPKKQKIEVGDLVILSARDCDESGVVDILEKIPRTAWRHVRKEDGIHRQLLGDREEGEDDLFDDEDINQNNDGSAESDGSLDIDDI